MLGRYGMDAGSLLGVEIASDSVRVLQLRRQKAGHTVIAQALEPLETGAGDGWHNAEHLALALRTAFHRSGSRQRRVALALPASQVICKLCQVPAGQSEAEMEAGLLADADRLFPFPLEDLAMDFQVLGPSPSHAGCIDVVVAASRQSVLQPLEAVIEASGLQLEAVEVDTIALQRLLPRAAERTSALLRIELASATLHSWTTVGLPQRREVPLQVLCDGLRELFVDTAWPDEVLVTGIGQDGLRDLGSQLERPVRLLPGLPAFDSTAGDMSLACALAMGGER